MMYKYFKYALCFLTAVGCDRALCGVHFWCTRCERGIEWEKWWTHEKEKHNGEHIAPSFLSCPASACKNPCLSLEKIEGCAQNVNEHIASVHGDKYITYDLLCKTCQEIIPRQFWEMHLQKSHLNHNDTVKESLPQYAFYCKECKGVFKTAKEWGEHVLKCEKRLQKESEWKVFYCPLCNKYPKTLYEDHVVKSHPKQCIYCFEKVQDEQSRRQHMKKAHKILCPFCDKEEFEVPLTVHIVRDHEIWEGPCPWDRRFKWCCEKCGEVIGYGDSRDTVKFPEGCYSDILSRKLLARLVQHYIRKHQALYEVNMKLYGFVQDIKRIEKSSDKIDKAYDEMGRFCIREDIMKISVEPCYRYFRYSGWHVLKGHDHHQGDAFDICTYCKNPLVQKNDDKWQVQKNDDKWHKQKEVVNEHRAVFHKGMRYCRLCESVCLEKDFDKHLMSDRKNKCWECPVCKEAVENFHHGVTEHQAGIGLCTECNRIGTGSCLNCGEWVYERCEKCPQRVYGTCPQCREAAFGSCPDCRQYIEGKCNSCGKEVKGKCLNCLEGVFGKCPICEKRATGWCSNCKQRVDGTCPVCGKCVSGTCSDCKQRVGVAPTIEKIFQSHNDGKHKGKLMSNKQGERRVCTNTTGELFRRCRRCRMFIPDQKEDLIAHLNNWHCPLFRFPKCDDSKDRLSLEVLKYRNKLSEKNKKCDDSKDRLSLKLLKYENKLSEKNKARENKKTKMLASLYGCEPGELFRWCEYCCTFVPNKEEDFIAHCRDMHKYSKHGWCALCKRDFNGTREDHLRKNHETKHCDGCRYDVLPGLSKWHSMRHSCYCIECGRSVPLDHMFVKHGCPAECKPTVDYGKLLWIFNHDKTCNNRHWWKCNLDGCEEKGSGDEAFKNHIIEAHKCSKNCECRREGSRFSGSRFSVNHRGCLHDENIRVKCPFNECSFSGTRAQVLSHVYDLEHGGHGCRKKECNYSNGRFEHGTNCKWKVWKCPLRFGDCSILDNTGPETVVCPFEGTREQIKYHMGTHGCFGDYCKFDKEGFFQHACTCQNRVFICPFCVDDKDKSKTVCVTKKHLKEHGCVAFCHVSQEDNDIEHGPDCQNRGKYKPTKIAVAKMKEFVKKVKELELRKAK